MTFDDEFCKPYYFNANEAYFTKHPEAYTEYMGTLISREGLKKSIEDKWVNSNLYQDALTEMRKTGKYAEISKYGDLWGFRFNNKSLINPIFTSEPKLQDNRFYKVALNNKLGIVDKYGMKIIDWDNDIVIQVNKSISVAFLNFEYTLVPWFYRFIGCRNYFIS